MQRWKVATAGGERIVEADSFEISDVGLLKFYDADHNCIALFHPNCYSSAVVDDSKPIAPPPAESVADRLGRHAPLSPLATPPDCPSTATSYDPAKDPMFVQEEQADPGNGG